MRSRPKLPWLDRQQVHFPDPRTAWSAPDGLLAAGGALTVPWLLAAYRQGIFPWFDDDTGPILWWSPNPRAGLIPGTMHVARSLRRLVRGWLKQSPVSASTDRAFNAVTRACAAPRASSAGTWITDNMHAAYADLHTSGHAHSVEIWRGEQLVGGIYGVAVGQLFCGESMFSSSSGGSKVAFFVLSELLARCGYRFLDAQMPTAHLASLGVKSLSRDAYLAIVQRYGGAAPGAWTLAPDLADLTALAESNQAPQL